jgi:hypothetical protein
VIEKLRGQAVAKGGGFAYRLQRVVRHEVGRVFWREKKQSTASATYGLLQICRNMRQETRSRFGISASVRASCCI